VLLVGTAPLALRCSFSDPSSWTSCTVTDHPAAGPCLAVLYNSGLQEDRPEVRSLPDKKMPRFHLAQKKDQSVSVDHVLRW
jgi:hypothetical protein